METTASTGGEDITTTSSANTGSDHLRPRARVAVVPLLAIAAATAVAVSNARGISIGDDGVGYQAIADSLLGGHGLGYFLEDPVTVWPPLWPALMALVALVTPVGTVGAAVILNCIVAALVVLVGNRLMRETMTDERMILFGTVVLAVGPATIGLSHVLMTDMAFALVVMAWMVVLIRANRTGSMAWTAAAALLAWVGFGLRYVGLTLIAFGGLWLLVSTRRLWERIRQGVLYGAVASVFPLAWMARNYSIDRTFTGERHTSARGLVDNAFDIAATIGRFLLPGVLNDQTKLWAGVGVILTLGALAATVMILGRPVDAGGQRHEDGNGPPRGRWWQFARLALASPVGLVGMWAVLYLAYMLYVRTTTALNQLDLRLLFPAYFPVLVLALCIAERIPRLGMDPVVVRRTIEAWAAANVAAGLVAMVAFGLGHSFFIGDYANRTFRDVRSNPALESLPAGCETYSNLPNALYPVILPRAWSPQRTALESIDRLDDLEHVIERSADRDLCLVWVDEKPTYGHLWTLQQLDSKLALEKLAEHGPVTVFRIHPQPGR